MSLYLEFDKLVRQLAAGRVRYAVAGGLAVGLHGYVRATEDVDLLIAEADEASAVRIVCDAGYAASGPPISFPNSGLRLRRFFRGGTGAEDLLVVDLLVPESPEMRGVLSRAQDRPYVDITIRVVSPPDLIWMKNLRGSKADAADIENLQRIAGPGGAGHSPHQ